MTIGAEAADINRKRWAKLEAAGLVTPAGLAAAPTDNTYARNAY